MGTINYFHYLEYITPRLDSVNRRQSILTVEEIWTVSNTRLRDLGKLVLL